MCIHVLQSDPCQSCSYDIVIYYTVQFEYEYSENLSSRDVQYLIAYTSNQNILVDGEWFINGATPPLTVSHKFGFGAIDAEAIVTRARTWISVPERQTASTTPTPNTG